MMRLGLAIDFAPGPGASYAQTLRELEPILHAAGEMDFDSISAGESYVFDDDDPMGFHAPNALLMLAAISRLTDVPRLVTSASLIGGWDPLRLAYDTALVDQLTGGRLVLGLGLGSPASWHAFGVPREALADRLESTIERLRRAWAGDVLPTADGESPGNLVPRPSQPGGPQIWVGGAHPAAPRRAARLGDGYCASTGYPRAVIRDQAARYRAEQGQGTVSANRLTLVAPTDEEAAELASRHLSPLLRAYAGVGVIPGRSATSTFAELCPPLAVVGSPATVASQLRGYSADGVTHIQARVLPQGTPLDVALRTMQLLKAEVLPRLAEIDPCVEPGAETTRSHLEAHPPEGGPT